MNINFRNNLQVLDTKQLLTASDFVSVLPVGDYHRVVIKPNWVIHETLSEFPIGVLVTNTSLIGLVIEACFLKYKNLQLLIVGDVPLQSCDFSELRKQAKIDLLEKECVEKYGNKVQFLDLRREAYKLQHGFMVLDSSKQGDPAGYSEQNLDDESHLEEISHRSSTFRVSDYDPKETTSMHQKGKHRYLVARSILEADLVINMPKMKTHQKSGITGALKNLVGINGSKAYLVHHQLGKPSQGGDEFPEDISPIILLQTRLRSFLQKRSRGLFHLLRWFWFAYKRLTGLKTVATRSAYSASKKIYTAAGSWYGNDSIWRMVYDLNMILVYGKPGGGKLANSPQRKVLHIMDAGIAGEGNGPLQALPVEVGCILISENPFLIDFGMAKMMGFDWRKIRMLSNFKKFLRSEMVAFDPDRFEVVLNGNIFNTGIEAIPVKKSFLPPPGWIGHIELD